MSACSSLSLRARHLSAAFSRRSAPPSASTSVLLQQEPCDVSSWQTSGGQCPVPALPGAATKVQDPGHGAQHRKHSSDRPHRVPSIPKHLTSLVTACNTLNELQAVCWTYHAQLAPIQISAAFTTCVRITATGNTHLGRSPSAGTRDSGALQADCRQTIQLVGWLLDRLSTQRASCSSREVANVLWCLAKMRYHPGPLYVEQLLDHFLDVLPTTSSQGISMTLYALAQLHHNPSSAWLSQVIPALVRTASSEAANGLQPVQALSNSCWALAKLEVDGAGELLVLLLQWLVQHVAAPQHSDQKQKTAAAASLLDQPDQLPVLEEPVLEDAPQQLPDSVMQVLSRLRDYHWQRQQQQEASPAASPAAEEAPGTSEASPDGALAPPADAQAPLPAPAAAAAPAPVGSQAFANIVWATAVVAARHQQHIGGGSAASPDHPQARQQQLEHLGVQQVGSSRAVASGSSPLQGTLRQLVLELLVLAAPQLQHASCAELAMLMWGAGRLQVTPPAPWWAGFFAASQQQLPKFTVKELSMLLLGCVRCRAKPPVAWMAAFCSASAPQLHQANSCELSLLVWSFGKWGFAPSAAWMRLFTEALADQLHSCTGKHIALVLYGLARLRYLPPEDLQQQLLRRCLQTLGSTRDQHMLAQCLYALLELGHRPNLSLQHQLLDSCLQLLGGFRPRDMVLLLVSLLKLQPQPRVSPGQLWLALERERCLVQFRVDQLRQRMAALQGDDSSDDQQQQQQQQDSAPGRRRAGAAGGGQARAADAGVLEPSAQGQARTDNSSSSSSSSVGGVAALEEAVRQGSWLLAGMEDTPPPAVLMQSYLEVVEEEEEQRQDGLWHDHQQQLQSQQAGEAPPATSAAPAAAAASWRWLDDALAAGALQAAASRAGALEEVHPGGARGSPQSPRQSEPAALGASRFQGSSSSGHTGGIRQGTPGVPAIVHQIARQLQQHRGSPCPAPDSGLHTQHQQPAPAWLQVEQWQQRQQAAPPPVSLESLQQSEALAEGALLQAAKLLQQAARAGLCERDYVNIRRGLLRRQRALSQLYRQQQAAAAQGELLPSSRQVAALFCRVEEVLPVLQEPLQLLTVFKAAAWLGADVSSRVWSRCLLKQVLPVLPQYHLGTMSSLLWSLVQLQGYLHPPPRFLLAAVARCEELLATAGQPGQPGQTQRSPTPLILLVWSLVRLQCAQYIGPRWVRAYTAALTPQLHRIDGLTLGVALRSMLRLRMAPYVPDELLQQLELLLEVKSAAWPPQALGLVAASIVQLQQQKRMALRAAVEAEAAARAEEAAAMAALRVAGPHAAAANLTTVARDPGAAPKGNSSSSRLDQRLTRRRRSNKRPQDAGLQQQREQQQPRVVRLSITDVMQAGPVDAADMTALLKEAAQQQALAAQQPSPEGAPAAAGKGVRELPARLQDVRVVYLTL